MVSYTRMHGELISFEASDKVELVGMLCAPVKTKTCLVHVHGMTDFFHGTGVVDALMKAAFKNDMAFFAFDNRGSGTINIFRKLKEHLFYRTMGTSFEKFKECLFDIDAALKMLRERGYTKFILSGHSTGCQKITYYQFRRNKKSVLALILLAPSDDLNYQVKLLGRRKYRESVDIAKRLVRSGRGKEIMPPEVEPSYFSAKRYYELYRPDSLEGNLYNYDGPMKAVSNLNVPVLAVFGSKEDFAVISSRRMLKILSHKLKHAYSKSVLIPDADHCFCMYEGEIEEAVAKWLEHMVYK